MKIIKRRFSLNKEKPETDDELPDDVIDRVNIGVVAVSLSLYEEGMSLEELIEVTGIRESDVRKSLEYLMINRMVRKKLNQESLICNQIGQQVEKIFHAIRNKRSKSRKVKKSKRNMIMC